MPLAPRISFDHRTMLGPACLALQVQRWTWVTRSPSKISLTMSTRSWPNLLSIHHCHGWRGGDRLAAIALDVSDSDDYDGFKFAIKIGDSSLENINIRQALRDAGVSSNASTSASEGRRCTV